MELILLVITVVLAVPQAVQSSLDLRLRWKETSRYTLVPQSVTSYVPRVRWIACLVSAFAIGLLAPLTLVACGGGGGGGNSANPSSPAVVEAEAETARTPPVETVPVEHVQITRTYEQPSSSMEPTLHCARPGIGCEAATSDQLVVKSFSSSPKRGDILAFNTPTQNGVDLARQKCGAGGVFIKRLIGLPREMIEERLIGGKGYIFINGGKLDEPYVKRDRRDSMTYGPYTIPKGDYFMMGDNRIQSCDSREWGPMLQANIIGRVVKIRRVG